MCLCWYCTKLFLVIPTVCSAPRKWIILGSSFVCIVQIIPLKLWHIFRHDSIIPKKIDEKSALGAVENIVLSKF